MKKNTEFVYEINGNNKDKNSKKFLLSCHLIKTITSLFVSTFLVAYIYKFSDNTFDYVFNVATYYLSIYGTMYLFYPLFSRIIDKTNRVSIFRIGIVTNALLIVIIIFFGQQLANLLILAGCLYGFSEVLYYTGYNILKEEMVGKSSVGNYISTNYIISRSLNIFCPVLLGLLIDVTTYPQTALVVFALASIQFGLSFGVKSKRPKDSNYNIKEYKSLLKQCPIKKQIKFLYLIAFFYGTTTLNTILLNINVMLQFGTNFSLGAIKSIFAVAGVITMLLIKNFTNIKNRRPILIISSFIIGLTSIVFVINTTKTTVILLQFAAAVIAIIYQYLIEGYRCNTLKTAGLYDQIAEHQNVFEGKINTARLICFGFLLLSSFTKSTIVFNILTIISFLLTSTLMILLYFFENKFVKKDTLIKKKEKHTEENSEQQVLENNIDEEEKSSI